MELIQINNNNINNQLISEDEVNAWEFVTGLADSMQNQTENWFLN